MANAKKAYCPHCFYFEVNINDSNPYLCALWGLKTPRSYHPSREIFLATGNECPYFHKRPTLKKQQPSRKKSKKNNQGLDFLV